MIEYLDIEQRNLYDKFLEFSRNNITPYSNSWERQECIPREIIDMCSEEGYMGGMLPAQYKGKDWNITTYGLFNEVVGCSSVSLSGLFNVHTMIQQTILKWGTEKQRDLWLPKMAEGEIIGAFALTEPEAGSDIKEIKTEFTQRNDKLILNGKKRWITFGGIADVVLVFGKLEGKAVACLVERDTPGFTITQVTDMLGFKASQLAVLEFNNCEVDINNMIGKPGFALSHIAPYALEFGRVSVAFAALGILRGCLEICGLHSLERKTFGKRLVEHGSIGKMITDMGVDLEAASLLCLNACKLKDEHSPDATEKIMIAKYFTTCAAAKHSSNAVQILGALGCSGNSPLSRYYRDSKAMEIIEGSSQIHQMMLSIGFSRKSKRNKSNY